MHQLFTATTSVDNPLINQKHQFNQCVHEFYRPGYSPPKSASRPAVNKFRFRLSPIPGSTPTVRRRNFPK
jgi:hypothetical protein